MADIKNYSPEVEKEKKSLDRLVDRFGGAKEGTIGDMAIKEQANKVFQAKRKAEQKNKAPEVKIIDGKKVVFAKDNNKAPSIEEFKEKYKLLSDWNDVSSMLKDYENGFGVFKSFGDDIDMSKAAQAKQQVDDILTSTLLNNTPDYMKNVRTPEEREQSFAGYKKDAEGNQLMYDPYARNEKGEPIGVNPAIEDYTPDERMYYALMTAKRDEKGKPIVDKNGAYVFDETKKEPLIDYRKTSPFFKKRQMISLADNIRGSVADALNKGNAAYLNDSIEHTDTTYAGDVSNMSAGKIYSIDANLKADADARAAEEMQRKEQRKAYIKQFTDILKPTNSAYINLVNKYADSGAISKLDADELRKFVDEPGADVSKIINDLPMTSVDADEADDIKDDLIRTYYGKMGFEQEPTKLAALKYKNVADELNSMMSLMRADELFKLKLKDYPLVRRKLSAIRYGDRATVDRGLEPKQRLKTSKMEILTPDDLTVEEREKYDDMNAAHARALLDKDKADELSKYVNNLLVAATDAATNGDTNLLNVLTSDFDNKAAAYNALVNNNKFIDYGGKPYRNISTSAFKDAIKAGEQKKKEQELMSSEIRRNIDKFVTNAGYIRRALGDRQLSELNNSTYANIRTILDGYKRDADAAYDYLIDKGVTIPDMDGWLPDGTLSTKEGQVSIYNDDIDKLSAQIEEAKKRMDTANALRMDAAGRGGVDRYADNMYNQAKDEITKLEQRIKNAKTGKAVIGDGIPVPHTSIPISDDIDAPTLKQEKVLTPEERVARNKQIMLDKFKEEKAAKTETEAETKPETETIEPSLDEQLAAARANTKAYLDKVNTKKDEPNDWDKANSEKAISSVAKSAIHNFSRGKEYSVMQSIFNNPYTDISSAIRAIQNVDASAAKGITEMIERRMPNIQDAQTLGGDVIDFDTQEEANTAMAYFVNTPTCVQLSKLDGNMLLVQLAAYPEAMRKAVELRKAYNSVGGNNE